MTIPTDPLTWDRTLDAQVTTMKTQYPSLAQPGAVGDRFESAIRLVREGAVILDADGMGTVTSRTSPGVVWVIDDIHGCPCEDAQYRAPQKRCAHRMALGLYRAVLKTLEYVREPDERDPGADPEPDERPDTPHCRPQPVAALPPGHESAPPEALFSLCLRGLDRAGLDAQLTVRGMTAETFLANVHAVQHLLQTPTPLLDPPRQEAPAPPTHPGAPAAASPAAGALTFSCVSLVGTFDPERAKTFWRIKGGRFHKHGVTIWPEVLDAAGFESNLEARVYPLTGWTAEYSLKEDNKSPDKVVRLLKTV